MNKEPYRCKCGTMIRMVQTGTGRWMPAEEGETITVINEKLGVVSKGLQVHWGRCSAEKDFRRGGKNED